MMPFLPQFLKPEYARAYKWDLRFLEMAKLVSGWSRDPSTKTGAVLTRFDNTVQSIGFNGFPKRMSDAEELYNDRETKYSRIVHCEINAMLFAKDSLRGSTLYTYPFCSCDRCAVQMIQAGINRAVFPAPSEDALSRWGDAFIKTKQYFQEADVEYTEIGDFS